MINLMLFVKNEKAYKTCTALTSDNGIESGRSRCSSMHESLNAVGVSLHIHSTAAKVAMEPVAGQHFWPFHVRHYWPIAAEVWFLFRDMRDLRAFAVLSPPWSSDVGYAQPIFEARICTFDLLLHGPEIARG